MTLSLLPAMVVVGGGMSVKYDGCSSAASDTGEYWRYGSGFAERGGRSAVGVDACCSFDADFSAGRGSPYRGCVL